MTLPDAFLTRPIAHRALHGPGRPENSRSAIAAAIAAGYGIELDLQLSADGVAMVFHDYRLDRLTGESGPVRLRNAQELAAIQLTGAEEGIPTLAQVLEQVAGQVPLLIEFKDQDGALGPNIGVLEDAAASILDGYAGEVALMSFNPHAVNHLGRLMPDRPRGLTTSSFAAEDWPTIPRPRLAELRDYARHYDEVGACFVSHEAADLANPAIVELANRGAAILCWTIRSPEEEATARRYAQNITFEGYAA